jgi:hypothetical protein
MRLQNTSSYAIRLQLPASWLTLTAYTAGSILRWGFLTISSTEDDFGTMF